MFYATHQYEFQIEFITENEFKSDLDLLIYLGIAIEENLLLLRNL